MVDTDSAGRVTALLEAATTSYLHGDYQDAADRCRTALTVEAEPPDLELDRQRIRVIELLLVATEPWWSTSPAGLAELHLAELLAQAEQIESRWSDPVIAAIVSRTRGKYLLLTDNLQRAIDTFAEAVAHARPGGDRLVEFAALTDLAHVQIGRDFSAGLALLREAVEFSERIADLRSAPIGPALVARLVGFVGVAEFDAGRFDPAESLLRRSLDTLHGYGMRDQLATMENFYGQLLIATGRFEEGETLLARSADVLTDFALASTHRAYNLGLLGKLYLEWDRPLDASAPLDRAWQEIRETDHKAIIPLVRNYRADLLLHPHFAGRDVAAAERLLAETVDECRQTGFVRSEVAALSLLGAAAQERGELDEAQARSAEAVTLITDAGTMPALRTEEVYLTHARILRASGQDDEARRWLSRAADVLQQKADTIVDSQRRAMFLERIPVSRAILAGCGGTLPVG